MKKGFLILIVFVLMALIGTQSHAVLTNVKRTLEHFWLAGDNQIRFGATPNANISYTGGNLVIDVTSGGGKVSIPDGIDLGTNGMDLASSLVFEGATADAFETTLSVVDPTTPDKTVTLPNQTGAVILSVGGVAEAANSISGGTGTLVYEGATVDAFETSLAVADTTASDKTVTLPDQTGTVLLSVGGATDAANAISGGTGTFVFEGTTADAFEVTVGVVDPTADATWSVPNFAVAASFLGSTLTTNTVDVANSVWGASNGFVFEGASADDFEATLTVTDPVADVTLTLPNSTGTLHNSGAYAQFSSAAPTAFTGATTTLLITNNVVKLSCDRAAAADTAVTLDETGALPGQTFWAYVDGNAANTGTCSFADAAGVQQASGRTLDDWDTISFIYTGTEWVENGGVNN